MILTDWREVARDREVWPLSSSGTKIAKNNHYNNTYQLNVFFSKDHKYNDYVPVILINI